MAVKLLDNYRSLFNKDDSLKDGDRDQLFFLKSTNPKNRMPALCIFNNHHTPSHEALPP